jgi:protein SCO1/2
MSLATFQLPMTRPLAVAMLLCCSASITRGVVITEGPEEMIGVGVEEQLGAQVPKDSRFRDHNGLPMTLGKLFNGERPVLLSLNYSNCPMLCGRQLNDLVRALNDPGMEDWKAGREFDVVSVSIDPTERPERAKQTHQRYTQEYGRPGSAGGWHFLVGDSSNIETLADTLGFRYKFIPDTGEYAHAATLIVVTPDGVVSRYINGVGYDAQTLRLSLVEAGDGKVGSTMDQILLTCFIYDHTKGKYSADAVRIMKIGAATTILVLGLSLAPYWLFRRRHAAASPVPDTESLNHQYTTDSETK